MTERQLSEFLQDILDTITDIKIFTENVEFEAFQANREKVLAVVKSIEILGEAVKKVPETFAINILIFLGNLLPECVMF